MNNHKVGEAMFADKILYFQAFDTCNYTMYTTCIIHVELRGLKH